MPVDTTWDFGHRSPPPPSSSSSLLVTVIIDDDDVVGIHLSQKMWSPKCVNKPVFVMVTHCSTDLIFWLPWHQTNIWSAEWRYEYSSKLITTFPWIHVLQVVNVPVLPIRCGTKNTSATSVYSAEYAIPIMFLEVKFWYLVKLLKFKIFKMHYWIL